MKIQILTQRIIQLSVYFLLIGLLYLCPNSLIAAPLVEPKAFIVAKKAFEDKLYSLSEKELRTFLKEYPQSASVPEARWLLVQSLYFQEKYIDALAEFKEPFNPGEDVSLAAGWVLWKAEVLSALQRWSEAKVEYERFLSTHRDDSRIWLARLGLSRAFFELGNTQHAISLLEELQALGSKDPIGQGVLLLRARIEITRGQYDEAHKLLEELDRRKLNNLTGMEASYWLGEIELKKGSTKKALDAFGKITDDSRIAPRRLKTLAWIGQGKAFQEEKDWIAAANAFEKAFLISDEAKLTHLSIQLFLSAHESNGNITAGITRARQWVDQKPAAAATLFYAIGESFFKQGNLEAALAELDRLQRSYPNAPEVVDALNLTADILLAKKDTEGAIRTLAKFIEKQPDPKLTRAVQLKLAQIYLQREDAVSAFSLYQPFASLEQKEALAFEKEWAEGLLLWKQADHAEKFNQLVSQFEGKFPSSLYLSGLLLHQALLLQKAGQIAESLDVLKKWGKLFEKQNPNQTAQALYISGLCFLQQADYAGAATSFSRIVKEFKHSPVAKQAEFYNLLCRFRLGEMSSQETIQAYEALQKDASMSSKFGALVSFQIAQIYYQKQDYPKALEAFEKLTKQYPKHELAQTARYYMGRCFMLMDKPKEAIEQFEKINTSSPLRSEGRLMMIDCYRLVGEMGNALKIAESMMQPAFETDPLWPQVAIRRASILYTLSSEQPTLYPKALAAVEAVLAQASICNSTELNEAGFIKGKILEKIGRTEDALQTYLDVIYQRILPQLNGPPQPEEKWLVQCALEAGQLQEKKGNIREAIAVYRLAERTSNLNRAAFTQKIAELKSRHFIME